MDYLMQEIYDHIFQNHTMLDFTESFSESWIDSDEETIYLASEEKKPLYKITIERL